LHGVQARAAFHTRSLGSPSEDDDEMFQDDDVDDNGSKEKQDCTSSTYGHSHLNTEHSVRNHEVSIIVYRSGIKQL